MCDACASKFTANKSINVQKREKTCKNSQMLSRNRKNLILDTLKRDGQIVAKTLSAELGLSEDTIRRDLRELAASGQLQRVHGGALPASPALVNLVGRQTQAQAEKMAIGRTAAGMVLTGQIVFIDGGTTCVQMARQLPLRLCATVVTHSPSVAVELVNHASIDVILLGGNLFKHSMVALGAATIEAIARIRADAYFMGVTGIHIDAGLSTGDNEEAHVKRALMQQAAETIVLASPEKLGVASAYRIARIEGASSIVTVRSVDAKLTAPFIAKGVSVVRV